MTEPTEDPGPLIQPTDLKNFAKIEAGKAADMCEDALSQAVYHAPCITQPGFAHRGMVKSILRGAILRWHEAGTGALQSNQKTAGIYGQTQTFDTRQPRKAMFYPSEIEQLKALCRNDDDAGGAFSIDTLPPSAPEHALACSLRLGGSTCSCGANLTGAAGYPLWEQHPDDGFGW